MRRQVSDYKYDKEGYLIPYATGTEVLSDVPSGNGSDSVGGVGIPPIPTNKGIERLSGSETLFATESGQLIGQLVDNFEEELEEMPHGWGSVTSKADEYLESQRTWHDKRDVASYCEVKATDAVFVKYLQRRSKKNPRTGEPPRIRLSATGQRIKWINTNWTHNLILPGGEIPKALDILLPFGAEQIIEVLPRTIIGIGGDGDSGKSHYGYGFADLNVGRGMPIRHFVNELGSGRSKLWLDDYPHLKKAWERNDGSYSLINLDDMGSGELDLLDCIDPLGITLFDYYHIGADGGDNPYVAQAEFMRKFALQITDGVGMVMMQKKEGSQLPYGSDMSKFQCDIMFTLWVEEQEGQNTKCRIEIPKCKSYNGLTNPKSLCLKYKTQPMYGKLAVNGTEGWISKSKMKEY